MSRELDVVTKAKLTLTKYQTLRDFASAVLSNEYNQLSLNFTRTLTWKLLLIPTTDSFHNTPITQLLNTVIIPELESHRVKIQKAISACDIPWDRLPRDSSYYRPPRDFELDIGTKHSVMVDPLSLPISNAEQDLQILELIILDVGRLFPQQPELFVDSLQNRTMVVELLYWYYKDGGGGSGGGAYRQGMHELMGIIFKAFYAESLSDHDEVQYGEPLELQLFSMYRSSALQYDVGLVFVKLASKVIETYYSETSLLQESIKFDLKLHELDKMLYHVLLTKLKIQTPLWILRYFRLVLLRELGIERTLVVWDKLIAFASSSSTPTSTVTKDITALLPYFILLLLLKLRSFILENEHDEILYALLHYPVDELLPDPQHTQLLAAMIQDCILLYNSEANLAALSKLMVHKYSAGAQKSHLKRVISLNRKKKSSVVAVPDPELDNSIGGNYIELSSHGRKKSKDFERTRLELRLAKRVNDLLKK